MKNYIKWGSIGGGLLLSAYLIVAIVDGQPSTPLNNVLSTIMFAFLIGGLFVVSHAIDLYRKRPEALREEREKQQQQLEEQIRRNTELERERQYELEKMKMENFSSFIDYKETTEGLSKGVDNAYEEYKNLDVTLIPLAHFSRTDYDEIPGEGHDFEVYIGYMLQDMGFENIQITQGSGDFGVDIVADNLGLRYVIQTKLYSSPVSNSAVQEVIAGKRYYRADRGIVVTNNSFTKSAIKQAKPDGILLWGNDELQKMINKN